MKVYSDNSPPMQRPIILLFDEYGNPLVVKYPSKKQPIGFYTETDEIKEGE